MLLPAAVMVDAASFAVDADDISASTVYIAPAAVIRWCVCSYLQLLVLMVLLLLPIVATTIQIYTYMSAAAAATGCFKNCYC